MAEILDIKKSIIFDESIAHCEAHSHLPYASSTFNNSTEIRIAVQHQDLCLLPSKSILHFYGRMRKADGSAVSATTKMISMAVCHMFEEIRYELNGVEIDRCKNDGITSVMKGYASLSPGQQNILENAGWIVNEDNNKLTNANGYFDVSVPLSFILGFAEDYQRIIVNVKHELNGSIKSGPVDIRLEFESSAQFPNQTTAYCLIIHDRTVEYHPISSTVRKLT
ncbi:uncharacterized protein LOC141529417 [Cotesia typhae]|uniref:uncharacterized protein LOC141529417 n=1 Tax=Cotesia typhae TaxID=2053667 RepID=UPI003D69BE8E